MTQGWRFRRAAALYAAFLAAFTCLSFYLHYLSHRLPFAQAQQRIVASFASETRDESLVHEYQHAFKYCQYASAFLSGTRPGAHKNRYRTRSSSADTVKRAIAGVCTRPLPARPSKAAF